MDNRTHKCAHCGNFINMEYGWIHQCFTGRIGKRFRKFHKAQQKRNRRLSWVQSRPIYI